MKVAAVVAVIGLISAAPADAASSGRNKALPSLKADYSHWYGVGDDGRKAIGKVVEIPGYRMSLASGSFEFGSNELFLSETKLILRFNPVQKAMVVALPTDTAMDNPLVAFKITDIRTNNGNKVYFADLLASREAPDVCYQYGDVEVPGAGDAARKLTSGPYQRFGYLHSLVKKGKIWFATVSYARYFWGTEAIREAKKDGDIAPDCYYIRDEKPSRLVTLVVDADCPFVHLTTDMRMNTVTWHSIEDLANALQGKKSIPPNLPTLVGKGWGTPFWFSVKGGKLNLIADQYLP